MNRYFLVVLTTILIFSSVGFKPISTYANDLSEEDSKSIESNDEDNSDKEREEETEQLQNEELESEEKESPKEEMEEDESTDTLDVDKDSDRSEDKEKEMKPTKEGPTKYDIGDKGQHVKELKKKLTNLGFGNFPNNPSIVYGTVTASVVEDFQSYYKLPQTGVADKKTLDKISEVINPPYRSGDRGLAIVDLKKGLTELGFGNFSSNPSIYYGSTTTKVVKEFQKAFGLGVDGIAGPETLDTLKNSSQNTLDGKQIVQLKKDLTALGFGNFPKNPSKGYGNVTSGVVKEFQSYYNLPKTGIADERTVNKINEVLNLPYRNGDRGQSIVQLKKDLSKLGFGNFPSNPSIYYGSTTTKVVKEFQKKFGLQQTGEANELTINKVDEILNSKYVSGQKGSHVRELKKDLTLLGFGNFPKNPSIVYGSVTASVVKEFQSYYKLPQTGIADEKTLDKINEVVNPPYRSGDRGLAIVEIKKDLTKLDFGSFPSNPSIYYGSTTTKVVKEFQEAFGLKVDGVVGKETLETLENPYQNILNKKQVIQLKKDLTQLGFGNFPNKPSNVYGNVTASVVREFQAYYKLSETGIANDKTLAKIQEVLTPPYRSGDRGLSIVELKKDLSKLGFGNFPSNPSIYYGSTTTKVVKDFQKAYGLKSNGIADKKTLEALANPYENGSSGDHIVELKRNITKIGFGNFPNNPSKVYGKVTAGVVEDIQKYYGLKQTGKADKRTLEVINKVLNSSFQNGKKGNHITQLKKDLTSLGYGNFPSNPSKVYGKVTENVVKDFQKDNNLVANGIVDEVTLTKLNEMLKADPSKPVNKTEYTNYNLTLNQALDIQMDRPIIQTDKYRNDPAYVSASYLNLSKSGKQATVKSTVNVRAGTNTSHHIFGQLKKGQKVNIVSKGNNWHQISYQVWRNPTRSDVQGYLDPSKNDKFQHLRLDSSVNVSASQLNKALSRKGTLEGQGQAFINANKKHGVNEAYLIAHAFLETGHGTSTLAEGVEVGKNKSGKPVRVTKSNRKNLTAIKTTYNMFGIGAVDSNPLDGGATTAYENGWFTPAAAIEGGAKWIGEGYIFNEHGQNTLYKMRWNPRMNEGYAYKQYASDIAWATKQVSQIKNIYKQLDNPSYHYDIARYK